MNKAIDDKDYFTNLLISPGRIQPTINITALCITFRQHDFITTVHYTNTNDSDLIAAQHTHFCPFSRMTSPESNIMESFSGMAFVAEVARQEPATDLSDIPISASDTTTSAVRGINSADEATASSKKVCFSKQVKVFKAPAELDDQVPTHVTFDEKIVDISDYINTSLVVHNARKSPSPPRKRVRFSCLKQPKQPLSHGLALLRMLRRRTYGAMPTSPVTIKKHVRFGALKREKANYSDATFGHRDSEWDEAETRRTFKRECMKVKSVKGFSSLTDGYDAEGEDNWDST